MLPKFLITKSITRTRKYKNKTANNNRSPLDVYGFILSALMTYQRTLIGSTVYDLVHVRASRNGKLYEKAPVDRGIIDYIQVFQSQRGSLLPENPRVILNRKGSRARHTQVALSSP